MKFKKKIMVFLVLCIVAFIPFRAEANIPKEVMDEIAEVTNTILHFFDKGDARSLVKLVHPGWKERLKEGWGDDEKILELAMIWNMSKTTDITTDIGIIGCGTAGLGSIGSSFL
jgi:hypothetical protein